MTFVLWMGYPIVLWVAPTRRQEMNIWTLPAPVSTVLWSDLVPGGKLTEIDLYMSHVNSALTEGKGVISVDGEVVAYGVLDVVSHQTAFCSMPWFNTHTFFLWIVARQDRVWNGPLDLSLSHFRWLCKLAMTCFASMTLCEASADDHYGTLSTARHLRLLDWTPRIPCQGLRNFGSRRLSGSWRRVGWKYASERSMKNKERRKWWWETTMKPLGRWKRF